MNYTVIVPFYNEEKNISSFNIGLINNLKKNSNNNRNFEIIYIDDGSKDNTFDELIYAINDSISHPERFKKQRHKTTF